MESSQCNLVEHASKSDSQALVLAKYDDTIRKLTDAVHRLPTFKQFDERIDICREALPDDIEGLETFVKNLTERLRQLSFTDESSSLWLVFDIVYAVPEKMAQQSGGKPSQYVCTVKNWVQSCFPDETLPALQSHSRLAKERDIVEHLSWDCFVLHRLLRTLHYADVYWFDLA